ncbi:hypothetical protein AB5I41_30120 [Sphingomonas sp. MMS24-JH45]
MKTADFREGIKAVGERRAGNFVRRASGRRAASLTLRHPGLVPGSTGCALAGRRVCN